MYRGNEFGEAIETGESARIQAALAASERLMPNMTDAREIQLLSDRKQIGDQQVRFVNGDDAVERAQAIAATARVLRSGKLNASGPEGRIVSAAIVHQLAAGGPVAADSLGPAISAELKDGMRLEIKPDSELTRKAREHARENGMPEPNYVRLIELRDRNGKVLGNMAVAVAIEKRNRGTLI